MKNERTPEKELGLIASWLDDYALKETDSTYLCFLRMLAELRHAQAIAVEQKIEIEERK